jgi:hypothetical protein
MTLERYAAFELATGGTAIKAGDIWWHQVRPFLYRPLLPFKAYDSTDVGEIRRIGAFQHAVLNGQAHDTYLNPIVFDELHAYDIKTLRKGVRGQIKKALQSAVTVSRIVDEDEFCEKGYPAYLSFFERTRYSFEAGRRQKEGFARWARTVLEFNEVVVLGSFAGSELLSFEISCLVEGALILVTIVNSGEALRLCVPDLLLHFTRTSAGRQPEIRMIFDSMLTQSRGINEFKLLRGARVLALPARLHMPRPLVWLVRRSSPSVYSRLHGFDADQLQASGFSTTPDA